jgi:hypothetical protein
MTSKTRRSANWLDVFFAPLAIGLLSMAGLLSALLFDGVGRMFSWAAVASPLVVSVWVFLGKGRVYPRRAKRRTP